LLSVAGVSADGCAATCAATARAHSSIAAQSRASRRSGGVFFSIAARRSCPVGGHAPPEHDVVPRAQLRREPLRDGRHRCGRMLVDSAERPAAEQPHGHVAQRGGVPAGEAPGLAPPALGVDRAPEHDRRVAGQVIDLRRQPRLRVAAGRAHRRADALGDLRRRLVFARVRHEHGAGGRGHVTPPRHRAR
jgi:hypothetical protein